MIRSDARAEMTRRTPPPIMSITRDAARLLRMLVALAVMLVAVLPHATLAAGLVMHAQGTSHDRSVTSGGSGSGEPCHENAAKPAAKAERPACCILGCVQIAETLPAPTPSMIPSWRAIERSPATSGAGVLPEPAEKPPRRAA